MLRWSVIAFIAVAVLLARTAGHEHHQQLNDSDAQVHAAGSRETTQSEGYSEANTADASAVEPPNAESVQQHKQGYYRHDEHDQAEEVEGDQLFASHTADRNDHASQSGSQVHKDDIKPDAKTVDEVARLQQLESQEKQVKTTTVIMVIVCIIIVNVLKV